MTHENLLELHLCELSAEIGSIREMNGHASAHFARYLAQKLAGRSLEELTLREFNEHLAGFRAERAALYASARVAA
jgi:hypothetical protein